MNHSWQKYFTKGILNKPSPLTFLFPKIGLKRDLDKLMGLNRDFYKSQLIGKQEVLLKLDSFNDNEPKVASIINRLEKKLKPYLVGAYVHGSYGTGEVINYSDFDGLLIIKDEVFESKELLLKVAKDIMNTHKFLISIDPLQHHGWFIASERQMKNWPVNYLPVEVLQRSRVLLGRNQLDLNFNLPETNDTALSSLCRILLKNLEGKETPKNYYELKSILSQFMLLPTLYYQFTTGKGIFKKESFVEVKKEFSEEEWKIMDLVSEWRKSWEYLKQPYIKSLNLNKLQSSKLSIEDIKKWKQTYRTPMITFVKQFEEKRNSEKTSIN